MLRILFALSGVCGRGVGWWSQLWGDSGHEDLLRYDELQDSADSVKERAFVED